MVRDSTHRPRSTDELLSLAARETTYRDTHIAGPISRKSALINFLDTSTDGGEEEDSDDGDTIVQLKDKSLDEEIQSTINELQRNSLTLQEAYSNLKACDGSTATPLDNGKKSRCRQGSSQLDSSTSASVEPSSSKTSITKEYPYGQTIPHTLSSKVHPCRITTNNNNTTNSQVKGDTVSEFGVPVFKSRPLFSESIRHMHLWRDLQGKGADGITFPQHDFGSSNYDSLVVPNDSGSRRIRSNSADGNTASAPLRDAKLQRPRSWMSNLLSVGSNSNLARLATTPMIRQRYHSFDDQPGQQAHLMPVSSLVLQDEFINEAPRQSLGRHAAASYSSPDLPALPPSSPDLPPIPSSPDSFSRGKPGQLFIRNLDSAPRGAYTPNIPYSQQASTSSKKMTNPWNHFERDLGSRKELIDPEEEEAMIHKAVSDKRRHGAMAGEERAVLDMLDEMNNAVDTFDRPTVSRAQSRVDTNSNEESERRRLQNASASPTRLSVKAFASTLNQNDASSRSSSPTRAGRASPDRSAQAASSASSSIGRQGGVKKVIEEREKLDRGLRVPSSRQKPEAGPSVWSALASSPPKNNSGSSTLSAPPMDRQDSASTVSSYASQTNAFLNRRATHAAEKSITHSPTLSNVSSGQGSSTTFWSKRGYNTESPFTSPDLPLGPEDKMTFRFDGSKIRGSGARPSYQRLMTNETGLTSLGSDVSRTPSKHDASTAADISITRIRSPSPVRAVDFAATEGSVAPIKPALFPTPFKAALEAKSSPSSALRTATTASILARSISPSASMESTSPDKLGSPKKAAKDLIRFFEETSAPNSPQQSPTRKRAKTPTTALRQSKEALVTSSAHENRPEAASLGADSKPLREQIAGETSSPLRQKARSRGWLTAATASIEERQPSYEKSSALGNEENMPFFQSQSSQQGSASFLKTGFYSYKSGSDRLMAANSPAASKGRPSHERQQDQDDRQSILSSRSVGTTRSYRETTAEGGSGELQPGAVIDTAAQPGASPLRTGFVYYFNVHASPAIWQWAQAVLLPTAIALSWIPAGGGRVSVSLDLVACREVHSVPGPDHPSSLDDIGARAAREQSMNRICPWQLIFDDGVERMAVESARDRVQWVNAIWDALGSAHQTGAGIERGHSAEQILVTQTREEVVAMPMAATTASFAVPEVRPFEAGIKDQVGAIDGRSKPFAAPPPLPPKAESEKTSVGYSTVSTSASPKRGSKLDAESVDKASKSGSVLKSAVREKANILGTPETIYIPRTPRSRAIFNWASVADSEIRPDDSASQRPARSQTNSSRYTAIGRGSDGKTSQTVTAAKRTVAQTIRDGVMSRMESGSEGNSSLDTGLLPISESTSSLRKPVRRSSASKDYDDKTVSARSTSTWGLPVPIKSAHSGETVGSMSSKEVARMMQRMEEEHKEREQRDAYLQSQLQSFQKSLNELSVASTGRRKGRRSTSTGSSKAFDSTSANDGSAITTIAADSAALLAMQEKLDKVLALVGNVSRSQMDEGAPRGPEQLVSSPSLTRIENTLQSLMTRMSPSTMPSVLAAHNRHGILQGDRESGGRDRAILADRLVKGTIPSSRRMSAPPDLEDEDANDVFSTPRQDNYVDMSTSPSLAGDLHRSNSRSWYAKEMSPAVPPNSLRKGSIISAETSRGDSYKQGRLYETSQYNVSNAPSLDMETEIRRRRMRQTAGVRADYPDNLRGGWYTPVQSGTMRANDAARSIPGAYNDPNMTPYISQAIQTPALDDRSGKESELGVVLDAIKENELTRKSQQAQQADIARYLNELNAWLEKDVEDRSKEWRTLALGVTQLHEEINSMKTGAVMRDVQDAARVPAGMAHHLEHGPAAALAYSAGVDRVGAIPGAASAYSPPTAVQQGYPDPMGYPTHGYGPAPINGPAPSNSFKRSGTRTWRAEASAGSMRNNDAFSLNGSAAVKSKKKDKAERKAEGRARRREAIKDSGFAKLAIAGAGAALIAAATHEYDKHKEKQRKEGKPEEASSKVDEKTGTFVQHKDLPESEAGKIEEAVKEGDEGKVREAIKHAAEAGAGAAAIQKLINVIKGRRSEKGSGDEASGDEENLPKNTYNADSEGSRSAKSSGTSLVSTDGSQSLEEAAKVISAGGGGGALALAVEEILKHLLEKKEEEKNKAKEEAQAKAAEEAKKKEEEEAREALLQSQREKDREELVEIILAKLKQERAIQEAEAAIKQKELDPKSAIENLVAAINQQRAADGAHQASADMAIKQMAADLVRTHSEQNGKMVEAVNAAAKEMLRHNVQTHAEDLKRILSKEVSVMFDDVGKIREAKRALEHEISDLFSIKARHLGDVTKPKTDSSAPKAVDTAPPPQQALPQPQPQQPIAAWGQPILSSPGKPKPLPVPMAMPMPATAMPRRDLVGPFSMSFGPRR